jgi:hypothetical protein
MRSDFPNMSYCMNRNTLLGLRQIMDAIDEEGTDFLRDMFRDEKFAFHDLVRACDAFVKQAEVLVDDFEQEQSVPDR